MANRLDCCMILAATLLATQTAKADDVLCPKLEADSAVAAASYADRVSEIYNKTEALYTHYGPDNPEAEVGLTTVGNLPQTLGALLGKTRFFIQGETFILDALQAARAAESNKAAVSELLTGARNKLIELDKTLTAHSINWDQTTDPKGRCAQKGVRSIISLINAVVSGDASGR